MANNSPALHTRFRTLILLAALAFLPVRAFCQLSADASASPIAQLVSRILERSHYSHHPLDMAISTRALAMYVDALDYQHMVFEKADVDSFETLYAPAVASRIKLGDVQPGFDIFNKFLTRLDERVAEVKKLSAEKQDFGLNERFVADRHEAPWPATPAEAAELWRLRIKGELLQEKLNKTKPEEIAKNVVLRYERLQRSYHEFDSNDVLQTYLTSLAESLDPHSEYMGPPQKDTFDISMRLSLTGIGAVLKSEDGYAKIVSLVPGGPAQVDKRLKPNDKIEAVAQNDEPFVDVVGMKLDRVVQMIRGQKGTTVRLRSIPNDALDPATRVVVTLVRDEIKLTEQEAKAKVIEFAADKDGRLAARPARKLGVIELPSFYADMKANGGKSTTRDVGRLIEALKKENVQGIVLDLRHNGGGALNEAISLTGLFIKDGPVVQVRDANDDIRVLRDNDGELLYGGPLVVLTSRGSASASEILAGAIQDYRRGIVVGEKSTFGKGTVQSMIELEDYMPPYFRNTKSGALKLTIQKFYRISGESTQNRGVIPDVHLPSVADYMDIAESALKYALPFDEIKPTDYRRTDSTTSALHALQKASRARVAASSEFAYVREDIARYKKQKAEKSVSLNEKARLAEKESDTKLTDRRKAERLARKETEPAAREITLASLEPGYQPPAVSSSPAAAPPAVAASSGSDVAQSSGTAKPGEDYAKAPPAPDYVLHESLNVLSDLIADSAPRR